MRLVVLFSDGVLVKCDGVIAGELAELRQSAERTRVQLSESLQREKVLVRRLAAKEQETQDYVVSRARCKDGKRDASLCYILFLHLTWCFSVVVCADNYNFFLVGFASGS